jgi:hypothetical protein
MRDTTVALPRLWKTALKWLSETMRSSDVNQRGAREQSVKQLEEQRRRIQSKREAT